MKWRRLLNSHFWLTLILARPALIVCSRDLLSWSVLRVPRTRNIELGSLVYKPNDPLARWPVSPMLSALLSPGSLNNPICVESQRPVSEPRRHRGFLEACPKTGQKVRIQFAPPCSLGCRENRLSCPENRRKSPQFLNFCSQTGPEKVSLSTLQASFRTFFSEGPPCSPVSTTLPGECNAITNRRFGETDLTTVRRHSPNRRIFGLRPDRWVGNGTRRLLGPCQKTVLRGGAAKSTRPGRNPDCGSDGRTVCRR